MDGEPVPGTAGVPVTAAKEERQVLVGQPFQVRVVAPGRLEQVGNGQGRGELRHKVAVPQGDFPIAGLQERGEVVAGDEVLIVEHAPPHDVEQGVGEVVRGSGRVVGELEAVRGGDVVVQRVAGLIEVRCEQGLQFGLIRKELAQFGNLRVIAPHIRNQVPGAGRLGVQIES